VAGAFADVADGMTRADQIDDAVARASELIAALVDLGPIAPSQAKTNNDGCGQSGGNEH